MVVTPVVQQVHRVIPCQRVAQMNPDHFSSRRSSSEELPKVFCSNVLYKEAGFCLIPHEGLCIELGVLILSKVGCWARYLTREVKTS